jgi:hypothetical protein
MSHIDKRYADPGFCDPLGELADNIEGNPGDRGVIANDTFCHDSVDNLAGTSRRDLASAVVISWLFGGLGGDLDGTHAACWRSSSR